MLSNEFRSESHRTRVELIEKLGCPEVDEVEQKLRLLVNQCLADIQDANRDVPARVQYADSNNSKAIKDPSQRFSDIEAELKELLIWFEGGQKPRGRDNVSAYVLSAMLGEAPFGDHLNATTSFQVDKQTISEPRGNSDTVKRNIYGVDILSADENIQQWQIDAYSDHRSAHGKVLATAIHPLEIDRPNSFVEFVRANRTPEFAIHPSMKDFRRAVSNDFEAMARLAEMTLGAIAFQRKGEDTRNKTTIARWAYSDPVFALVSATLNEVWPVQKGDPKSDLSGERRGNGTSSERRMLLDLATNLVELVQETIDRGPGFESRRFQAIRAPNTLAGRFDTDEHLVEMLALILALRAEHTAYFVVRHTIGGICDAAFELSKDNIIIEAANCVSAKVMTKLDHYIAIRRQFLEFGSDRPRGNPLKWFGRLDPDARQRWGKETLLANAVFPEHHWNLDYHFGLQTEMIGALSLDEEVLAAWRELVSWARCSAMGSWTIVRPEL